MSLEEALAANTAAITAHTAALKSLGAKAGAAAPAAGAAKPAAAAATKPAAKKAKTIEDLRAAAGAYLSVTDKTERQKRKDLMAKLNEHYGVAKISEVEATQIDEVLGYLVQLEAGEVPDVLGETEAEDEALV